ncbi:MAG: circadian clock protein KaiB [Nitriliruptoraceae bacterium]
MTQGPYILRLYVTPQTIRSEQAVATLQDIVANELAGEYELEVIDVLEQPRLAEEEGIVVTPTLVKEEPPPLRRIFGDLTDRDQVLRGLDLKTG